MLVQQAYSELKWEAFHRHRVLAEELAVRIDKRYLQLMKTEEARPFTDFSFLNVLGDTTANFLQRSVLAAFPVTSEIPGLIGYFQIDAEGSFSSPLLPAQQGQAPAYGVPESEYRQRLELSSRMHNILSSNRLVPEVRSFAAAKQFKEFDDSDAAGERADSLYSNESSASSSGARPAESRLKEPAEKEKVQAQAAFDLLEKSAGFESKGIQQKRAGVLGRVEDLKLDQKYQSAAEEKGGAVAEPPPAAPEKRVRKERSALPAAAAPVLMDTPGSDNRQLSGIPIRTFESELDRYQLSLLDSGQFVMFRKVWRDGQRYIQGMLIVQQPFLQDVIQSMFQEGTLPGMSDLLVAYRGDVLSVFDGAGGRTYFSGSEHFRGSLLFQKALSAPLDGLPSRRQLQLGIELPISVQSLKSDLEKYLDCKDADGVIIFVIEKLKGDNVGSISYHSRNRKNGTFSFGVVINRAEREKGYAADAVRILLRYGFRERRYQKCNSACVDANTASIRLHEKLGFVEEGRRRRNFFLDGVFCDDVLFGLTREEFDAI